MNKNSSLTVNKTVVLYPIRQKTEDFTNENAYEVDEIYEYNEITPKYKIINDWDNYMRRYYSNYYYYKDYDNDYYYEDYEYYQSYEYLNEYFQMYYYDD